MEQQLVTVDAIDRLLNEARVCNAQVNCIHFLLNEGNAENEEWRLTMEANIAQIFREMVSNLYSVLDYIFYFLYCKFQNNGRVSFSGKAFLMKQPIKLNLKFSEDQAREDEPECKAGRNNWVESRCQEIFGPQYYTNNDLKLKDIRDFQKNLLMIQAIREVTAGGDAERSEAIGGAKLVYARDIQLPDHQAPQQPAGEVNPPLFRPSNIEFQELKSVKDQWTDATTFNLLHFFRNFTTHRTLIKCDTMAGYLNKNTLDFRPIKPEDVDGEQWVWIGKGAWIMVPELSHLRDEHRQDHGPVEFHELPLIIVCARMLNFVRRQRGNIKNWLPEEAAAIDVRVSNAPRAQRVVINGKGVEWFRAHYLNC